MDRAFAIITLVLVFGIGFVFANAYAEEQMPKGWHRAVFFNSFHHSINKRLPQKETF
jgi:hypothetical protein